MVFKKLLKPIVIATFLLATILNIQPIFAMDDDEKGGTQSNTLRIIHKAYKKSLAFIGKGEKFESSQLPFQSQTPFFEALSNDETLYIISYLCTAKKALEELNSIALTCKKGYQLTQHSYLWRPLKERYFNHLPEEYIATQIEGKILPPRALISNLLQQLQADQLNELKQLKKILQGHIPQVIDEDDQSPPVILAEFLNDLYKILDADLGGLSNLKKISKYYAQEAVLQSINWHLIQECVNHMAPKASLTGPLLNINFRGSITRIPLEAIELIQTKIGLTDKNTTIRLSLPCNKLRWIPKELFSIKDVHILDLRNNFLSFLPPIEDPQETITHLLLGNYNDYKKNWFFPDDGPYLQTQGNVFKTLPSCVLKIKNLSHLDLRSVKLCNFPKMEFLDELPNLSTLNLDHNDLKTLPELKDKNRTVAITSMGHSLWALDMPTVKSTFYNHVKPKVRNYLRIDELRYKGPYKRFVRAFEPATQFFATLPVIFILYPYLVDLITLIFY
jgi:hypothetical protein